MNIERWVRNRRPTWQQLEELLHLIDRRGMASLNCEQLRQLGKLYRAASADLSRARALSIGGEIAVYLNHLVVKAHNQVYQRPVNRWRDLAAFLFDTFPVTVRENVVYLAISIAI